MAPGTNHRKHQHKKHAHPEPHYDVLYNGTILEWFGHNKYKASSGIKGAAEDRDKPGYYQNASHQTESDAGPIPEGVYSFSLGLVGSAQMSVVKGKPVLDTRQGIEDLSHIAVPRALAVQAGVGFVDLTNGDWGAHRVRLTRVRIDVPEAAHRDGFYLHDSHKGFSHGCIEVDRSFFTDLIAFAQGEAKKTRAGKAGKHRLVLRVKYPSSTASTYGGTFHN
jgi:hypothetical protein